MLRQIQFSVRCRLFCLVVRGRCKELIEVHLDSTLSAKEYDGQVKQYVTALSQKHADSCPWKNLMGCNQVADPLQVSRSQALTDFETRLHSFKYCKVRFLYLCYLGYSNLP